MGGEGLGVGMGVGWKSLMGEKGQPKKYFQQ